MGTKHLCIRTYFSCWKTSRHCYKKCWDPLNDTWQRACSSNSNVSKGSLHISSVFNVIICSFVHLMDHLFYLYFICLLSIVYTNGRCVVCLLSIVYTNSRCVVSVLHYWNSSINWPLILILRSFSDDLLIYLSKMK